MTHLFEGLKKLKSSPYLHLICPLAISGKFLSETTKLFEFLDVKPKLVNE